MLTKIGHNKSCLRKQHRIEENDKMYNNVHMIEWKIFLQYLQYTWIALFNFESYKQGHFRSSDVSIC